MHLHVDEARLLDERRYDEWLALFSDDGFYWMPLTPGQAGGSVSRWVEGKLAGIPIVGNKNAVAVKCQTTNTRCYRIAILHICNESICQLELRGYRVGSNDADKTYGNYLFSRRGIATSIGCRPNPRVNRVVADKRFDR